MTPSLSRDTANINSLNSMLGMRAISQAVWQQTFNLCTRGPIPRWRIISLYGQAHTAILFIYMKCRVVNLDRAYSIIESYLFAPRNIKRYLDIIEDDSCIMPIQRSCIEQQTSNLQVVGQSPTIGAIITECSSVWQSAAPGTQRFPRVRIPPL